jgi:hypothetical protein
MAAASDLLPVELVESSIPEDSNFTSSDQFLDAYPANHPKQLAHDAVSVRESFFAGLDRSLSRRKKPAETDSSIDIGELARDVVAARAKFLAANN